MQSARRSKHALHHGFHTINNKYHPTHIKNPNELEAPRYNVSDPGAGVALVFKFFPSEREGSGHSVLLEGVMVLR